MEHNLLVKINNEIERGQSLVASISTINVDGIEKLKKQIKQEIHFLSKVKRSGNIKKEYILSTNLHHFQALVACLLVSNQPTSVLHYFALSGLEGNAKRICVDIVRENGQQWIKVIARNPKALSQLSMGDGEFGQKSIIDKAVEYLECANQHPYLFKIPQVIFHFACGIESVLAERLEGLGITVRGERLATTVEIASSDADNDTQILPLSFSESEEEEKTICRLNLDVTAMIAYVSALTNGGCHFVFREPLLTQQAEWERARPVKPMLDQLFAGRELFCCESALKDFRSIITTMGGPGELSRTEQLMKQVTVTPDLVSPRVHQLRLGGRIKPRPITVFSTGDSLRAITVSANEGFVRAARNQGVEFAVFIHESRALTEGKEKDGTPLPQDS